MLRRALGGTEGGRATLMAAEATLRDDRVGTIGVVRSTVPHKDDAPVVMLFGFWGAKPSILRKYAAEFSSRGMDCVWAIAPFVSIMLRVRPLLHAFVVAAMGVLREVAGGRKVVLMAMSNGGCFPLETVWELRQAKHGKQSDVWGRRRLDRLEQLPAESVRGIHFAGTIFDSCPARFHVGRIATAASIAMGSGILGLLVYSFVYSVLSVISMLDWLGLLGPYSAEAFTRTMETTTPYGPELFLYSRADKLTESEWVEEVISKRRALPGAKVVVQHFPESDHVDHLRKSPTEYRAALDEFFGRF
jgi:hypothetical protein